MDLEMLPAMTPQLTSLQALPAAIMVADTAAGFDIASLGATTRNAQASDFAALLETGNHAGGTPAIVAQTPEAASTDRGQAATAAAILPVAGKTLPIPLPDQLASSQPLPPELAAPDIPSAYPDAKLAEMIARPASTNRPRAAVGSALSSPVTAAITPSAQAAEPGGSEKASPTLQPAARPIQSPAYLDRAAPTSSPVSEEDGAGEEQKSPEATPDLPRTEESAPQAVSILPAIALVATPPAAAALPKRDAALTTELALPRGRQVAPAITLPGAVRSERARFDAPPSALEIPSRPAEHRFSAATLAALAPTEKPAAVIALADAAAILQASPPPPNAVSKPASPQVSATLSPDINAAAPGTDLAQVVETIARTRAEVQQVAGSAGSVHVALRHAEFGAVSVRFEHERGDLAVSLSSPDPDFARAVAAVAPPQPAVSSNDASAARDGNARSPDSQAAPGQSGNTGHPQQQRSNGETPPRQLLATQHPGRRGASTASDPTPDGEGIFA